MKPEAYAVVLFRIVLIIGCCTAGIADAQNPKPNAALSEKLLAKAADYEKSEDYQKAIFCLKAAGTLAPDNPAIYSQLSELTVKAVQIAEAHYQKGVSLFQKNAFDDALKEFLIALRCHPDHPEALEYVKHKMHDAAALSYTVKSGDNLKSVARNAYKDPDKAFVIAYFNNLKPDAVPPPGRTLRFPILEIPDIKQTTPSKEIDVDKQIEQAKSLFASKRYDRVIAITKQILEKDYLNAEATELANASYYELGIGFFSQKKYKEALDMLNKADTGYAGVSEAIANIRNISVKEADHHYKEGVKHFVNDQLEKAIQEWESALKIDPDHKNASKDIENAKKLLEKLQKVQ